MEWLKNNVFQFIITTIIGVLAIIAAYNIFFLEQVSKQLQVVIVTNTPLIEVPGPRMDNEGNTIPAVPGIAIQYNGVPIENLTFLQVRIENTGNQEIRVTDYERPIQLRLPEEALLLGQPSLTQIPSNIGMNVQAFSTRVTMVTPRGIPELTDGPASPLDETSVPLTTSSEITTSDTVELTPVLLNPGDQVTLQMLVTNILPEKKDRPFDLDARIAGISRISVMTAEEAVQPQTLGKRLGNGLASVVILIGIATIAAGTPLLVVRFFLLRNPQRTTTWFNYGFYGGLVFLVIFLIFKIMEEPFVNIFK